MDALSQKDIDSLLKGAAPTAAAGTDPGVVPYNFLRPHRISKDRRATLQAIFSLFGANLQSLLSSRLRQPTDIVISSVEQAIFAEFVFSLGNPCSAFVYELGDELGVQAVIDVGIELAMHLVDRLFGGPGDCRDQKRSLTALEQLVVRGLTERIAQLLKDAWADHLTLNPTLAGFEGTPDTLQIVNREDSVLVVNIEVKSESFSGVLAICIPLMALESFLQEKASLNPHTARISPAERAAGRRQLESSLRCAHMPVCARFPLFLLRARDLADLSVGQVIHTGRSVDTPVEVHVNGRQQFEGSLGQTSGFMGLRITGAASGDPLQAISRAVRGKTINE